MYEMRSYYLSDGVKKYGPFSRPQIIEMLKSNQISMMSFILDTDQKQWDPIYKHADFTQESMEPQDRTVIFGLEPAYDISKSNDWAKNLEQVNRDTTNNSVAGEVNRNSSEFPSPVVSETEELSANTGYSEPDPEGSHIKTKKEIEDQAANSAGEDLWQMKLGSVQLGPYTYLKMLTMIHDGDLREQDLVRKMGTKAWSEAKDIPVFQREYVKGISDPLVEDLLKKDFFRRESSRRDFHYPIIIFDGRTHYNVIGADISLGGLSFISRPPILKNGQTVVAKLEHSVTKSIPGYHAKLTILTTTKVQIREEGGVDCYRYGASIKEIMPSIQDFLRDFLSSSG